MAPWGAKLQRQGGDLERRLGGDEFMANLQCSNCHGFIPNGVHPYTIRIELFPRVEESLEFTQGDFEIDFDEEISKIVQRLEAMSEDEKRLEEERTYSSFSFVLCISCRDKLSKALRHNLAAS